MCAHVHVRVYESVFAYFPRHTWKSEGMFSGMELKSAGLHVEKINLLNHHTSPHVIFLSNKQNHSVMYSQKYYTSNLSSFKTFDFYFSND